MDSFDTMDDENIKESCFMETQLGFSCGKIED